jgi:multiple antibiotic resistance protein
MNEISIFSLAVILFLIMDPVGNISSYLFMVQDIPRQKERWIITRELMIALAAMIVFSLIGEYLFTLLQIDQRGIHLASGLILFLIAIKILFPTTDSPRALIQKGEPFISPLAIPLIAGPSLLATIMLFSDMVDHYYQMLLAILYAWIASFLVLYNAHRIQKILGVNGLMAIERLMGLILVLIAIQRFLEGVKLFLISCQ